MKSLKVRMSDSVAVPTYCAISSREISMGIVCFAEVEFIGDFDQCRSDTFSQGTVRKT